MKKLLIGNAAVALGAYEAGVKVATAYPGTPSTEITEFINKYKDIYCEWSPNEKVALEVAAGSSVAGVRSICSMKHVGLNVAADPLFTAAYTGVNGGLVIVVADDPGMHSSQNEQDSRFYARSANVPMLEPSDSNEAKEFTKLAFDLSEEYDIPVLIRLTTKVAHSQSFVSESSKKILIDRPYVKNIAKYVMVPGNAKLRHIELEKKLDKLAEAVNLHPINSFEINDKTLGIVCAGNVYQYVKEALPKASVYKIGTVYPLPIKAIKEFSKKVKKLVVIEELEPFIENQLKAAGVKCIGKEFFSKQGELSVNIILEKLTEKPKITPDTGLPSRPPVMCAGCPHRGVFYTLNKLKLNVTGDIGCYSLGASAPLNAMETLLCMGASVGMAHGMEKAKGRDFSKKTVAVIGDSTFIHSGITPLINAVYNKSNITLIILDNSTTGMTGHQEHAATGKTIKNEETAKLNFFELAKACGAKNVVEVDAYNLSQCEAAIRHELTNDGVSVIIAKQPCALLSKTGLKYYNINENCINCKACLKLGCPAICVIDKSVVINKSLCFGCGVCVQVCKSNAIV